MVVGDSVFDVQAAAKAGMPAVVVRSGGFGDDELREAGAIAIFDTPADLAADLDTLDLDAQPARPAERAWYSGTSTIGGRSSTATALLRGTNPVPSCRNWVSRPLASSW